MNTADTTTITATDAAAMPELRPTLSVLIVSFNTRELTLVAAQSVLEQAFEANPGAALELIVWDNASHDGSAQALTELAERDARVRVVACDDNLGFAVANNRASELATGRWLLLLNSDTQLHAGTLDRLLSFAAEHPQAGVIGGRTFFGDGTLNPTSVYGRPSLRSVVAKGVGLSVLGRRSGWLNPESMGRWARDTPREVAVVTGCFALLERAFWDELGGFDTGFFMYGEDWDLCMRSSALGRPCWLCPEATLVHHGGRSEAARAGKMVKLFTANAQLFRKHWPRWKAWLAVRMLDSWALTRWVGAATLRRSEAAATWHEVWSQREAWRGAA